MGSAAYSNNAFVQLMNDALAEEGRVEHRAYSFWLSLTSWPQVWHFNWPERSYRSSSSFVAFLRAAKLLVQIRWARLMGAKIAWTVHNLTPHDSRHPRIEAWFWRRFRASVDLFVHLSTSGGSIFVKRYPETWDSAHLHLRHPAYPIPDKAETDRSRAREQLAIDSDAKVYVAPGILRPYKNVPETIEVFRQMPDSSARLVVAGFVISESLKEDILRAAADDPRISIDFGFMEEEHLYLLISASDYVLLPYDDFLNSGLLMLALSLSRPVIVPRTPVTNEISTDVGSGWIVGFDGALNQSVLVDTSKQASQLTDSSDPELSKYSWVWFAERLSEAFHQVVYDS